MARYTVQDDRTKKTITFEWDGDQPPTDADMEEVFAEANARAGTPVKEDVETREPKTATQRMANMAANIPENAVDVAKAAYTTVRHPVQTLTGIGEALGSAAYDVTHMTDEQKAAIKQRGIEAAKDPIGTINTVLDKAADYIEQNPVDAALLVGSPKIPKASGNTARAVIDTLAPSERTVLHGMEKNVTRGIEKGIRPSVEGKRTFGMSQKYLRNASDAVEHIIDNKGSLRLTTETGEIVSGKLPENLKQFSEAIDQTKRGIFEQYNAMAEQAGGAGGRVDLTPISKELDTIAHDPKLRKFAPGIANYAANRSKAIMKGGADMGVVDAQDAIAIMNKSLESFYKNPSYESATKAYIDSLVVNNLRRSVDRVIETQTGPGYAELKKSYGSLKAIERDVNRRAVVDARKNVKGIIDFSDIFSGATAVHGILSMNPGLVASSVTAKAIASLYKLRNDPNRIVKNMFAKQEKLMDKRRQIQARRNTTGNTTNTDRPMLALPAPSGTTYSLDSEKIPSRLALPAPQTTYGDGFIMGDVKSQTPSVILRQASADTSPLEWSGATSSARRYQDLIDLIAGRGGVDTGVGRILREIPLEDDPLSFVSGEMAPRKWYVTEDLQGPRGIVEDSFVAPSKGKHTTRKRKAQ